MYFKRCEVPHSGLEIALSINYRTTRYMLNGDQCYSDLQHLVMQEKCILVKQGFIESVSEFIKKLVLC
jgi:hypothetical protein